MYDKIKLFNLEFISAQSHFEFVDEILNYEAYLKTNKKLPFLITPNADQLVRLPEKRNHILKEKLTNSLFILPDGQSIILFSKLVGKPLKNRLNGSDLFPILWGAVKQNNQRVFVITTNDNVGSMLQADYPNLVYYSPPFFDPYKNSIVLDKIIIDSINIIKSFYPKYVIVGIGFPKQEFIGVGIYNHLIKDKVSPPLFLFLGASFEFYLKVKKRAPSWMLKWGLEWLHRLIQEPRRMWKRYFIGAFRLLLLWIKQFPQDSNKNK